jgi:mandelate racemase
MEPDRLSTEADALLAGGLKAVKLRLGYPSVVEDITALKAVRRAVGDDVAIMVRPQNGWQISSRKHAAGNRLPAI